MGRAGGPPGSIAQVRPARPEDGVGLSALLTVLGYPCPAEEAAQRVIDLREDPNQTLLVAEMEGQLAGLVLPEAGDLQLPSLESRSKGRDSASLLIRIGSQADL